MNQLRYKFVRTLSPALAVAMLLWAAHLTQAWPAQSDARPYHDRSRLAVTAIPLNIGRWSGKELKPQAVAVEMLRPNVIRTIEFTDPSVAAIRRPEHRVWLNIVQCRYAADMLGHEPARCYPSYGDVAIYSRRREWTIPAAQVAGASTMISGTEYRFERTVDGKSYRRVVYNFMIAPGRGIVSDMKELEKAAEDYQRRYHGAAQVQVVFASLAGQELGEAERDEVFSTLMQASLPAVEVLKSGE